MGYHALVVLAASVFPVVALGVGLRQEEHQHQKLQRHGHSVMRREQLDHRAAATENAPTSISDPVKKELVSTWPAGRPCIDDDLAANAQLKADKLAETGCAGMKKNCEVAEWKDWIYKNCPKSCTQCVVGWTTRHGTSGEFDKVPAGWRLIAAQNMSAAETLKTSMHFNVASRQTLIENADDPAAPTYMIIGDYDAGDTGLKFFGGYHFALMWDGFTNVRWTQTSWLNDTQITGFECEHPLNCGPNITAEGAQFKGLGRSGGADDLSILDGNGGSDYWWNAVGTLKAFEVDKIPGWQQRHSSTMELYMAERRWNLTVGCPLNETVSYNVAWHHDKAAYGICCATGSDGKLVVHRQDKMGNCFNDNQMVTFFKANATCAQQGMSACNSTALVGGASTCDANNTCGWNGQPMWAGVELQPEFWTGLDIHGKGV